MDYKKSPSAYPIEHSNLKAIEKALFQQYYDKIDGHIILLADNNDISDIEQIFGNDDNWGEVIDFSIEEMLDKLVMSDKSIKQDIVQDSEVHDYEFDYESFHEIFIRGIIFFENDD